MDQTGLKRLYILRHAQALPQAPGGSDAVRPLSDFGREDAQILGQILAARAFKPDLVLCSPANRTQETLELVLAPLPGRPPVQLVGQLYLAPLGILLAHLRASPNTATSILMVGHNPGLENLISELTRPSQHPVELRQGLATCAFVTLDFDMDDWRFLTPDEGRVTAFIQPQSSHP